MGGLTDVLRRPDYSKAVTVYVGKKGTTQRPFVVHEDLLFHNMPLLRTWPRTQTQPSSGTQIRIGGYHAVIFDVYIQWMSSPGEDPAPLARALVLRKGPEPLQASEGNCVAALLLELWKLADQLGDRNCKKRVINSLLAEMNTNNLVIRSRMIMRCLETVEPTCVLWKLAIDSFLAGKEPDVLDRIEDRVPAGFEGIALRRLMEKIHKSEHLGAPRPEDACRYHCHEPGEGKCT